MSIQPNSSHSLHRPRTHKPRGVCRYYTTERGCFAGDGCKFLHGAPEQLEANQGQHGGRREGAGRGINEEPLLTPYDQSKTCRYFTNGYCRRGDACWFKHALPMDGERHPEPSEPDSDSEILCSICFEKPVTFGLLVGCNHIFCISCIRKWRDPAAKSVDVVDSGNTKKCPMCRAASHFIAPSSIFAEHGTPEKGRILENYRNSMARVPCKYFEQSKTQRRANPTKELMCPFGKDCFYKHVKEDGTPFVFTQGADVWMRKWGNRDGLRARRARGDIFGFDEEDDALFLDQFMPLAMQAHSLSLLDFLPNILSRFGDARENAFGDEGTGRDSEIGRGTNRTPRDVEMVVGTMSATASGVATPGDGPPANTNRNSDSPSARTTTEFQAAYDRVGRTLDAVTNAFHRSADLRQLSENLRRIRHEAEDEATADDPSSGALPANARRGAAESREGGGDAADAMERLEVLAGQILASTSILRNGVTAPQGPRTNVSRNRDLPPSEHISDMEDDDDGPPPLQVVSDSDDDSDLMSDDDFDGTPRAGLPPSFHMPALASNNESYDLVDGDLQNPLEDDVLFERTLAGARRGATNRALSEWDAFLRGAAADPTQTSASATPQLNMDRAVRHEEGDARSVGSMPELLSVSDSEDDGMWDVDSDSDFEFFEDVPAVQVARPYDRDPVVFNNPFSAIGRRATSRAVPTNGGATSGSRASNQISSDSGTSTPTISAPSPAPPMPSTSGLRPQARPFLPRGIPPGDSPTVASNGDVPSPEASASTHSVPGSEPPFMTDGRGRVVWTSHPSRGSQPQSKTAVDASSPGPSPRSSGSGTGVANAGETRPATVAVDATRESALP